MNSYCNEYYLSAAEGSFSQNFADINTNSMLNLVFMICVTYNVSIGEFENIYEFLVDKNF